MNPNQEQFLTVSESQEDFNTKRLQFLSAVRERYSFTSEMSKEERLAQVVRRRRLYDQLKQIIEAGIRIAEKEMVDLMQELDMALDGTHQNLEGNEFSVRYDPLFNYPANDTYYREVNDPNNPEKMLKVAVAYSPTYNELQESVEAAKRVLSRARKLVTDREKAIKEDHPRMFDVRPVPKYIVQVYGNKFEGDYDE